MIFGDPVLLGSSKVYSTESRLLLPAPP